MLLKDSILELSELVSAIEEGFGVSAAMVVAGGGGGAAAEEDGGERQAEFTVMLNGLVLRRSRSSKLFVS